MRSAGNMTKATPCGLPLILKMPQMHFLPEAFDLSGLLLAIMKRTQLRKRASIFEFKIGCVSSTHANILSSSNIVDWGRY
jgi:hypothetical protein